MQKFFKQLLQFLSGGFGPKSSHIIYITMRETYYAVAQPSKAKDLRSQISSIYDKSMKSQQIKFPISATNRIKNNRSQSLMKVHLRQKSQRKGDKSKTKLQKEIKIKQGMFSQDHKSKQKNKPQKDAAKVKSKQEIQLNNKMMSNKRLCDQKAINPTPKIVKKLKTSGKIKDTRQKPFNIKSTSNLKIPIIEIKTNKKIKQQKSQTKNPTNLLKRCLKLMKKIEQIISQKQHLMEDLKQVEKQQEDNSQIDLKKIEQQMKSFERLPKDLQDIFKNIAKKKQALPQRRRQKSSSRQQLSNLFSCNILNKEEDYKLFLIQTLSNNFGDIKQTKFLYHQDNLNQNNIHRYIDGKRNIAIIIQTVDDYFVALFAQPPFQPRQEKGKGLTQRRVYKNLPQKSPIVYDEAFVIFGNSDVKIGDKQIHTQFGNPTSYYDCKGDKASILFGSGGKKDFEIKYLEIFEVIF